MSKKKNPLSGKKIKDGGATATIIAAIIASVTAAATASASAAQSAMADDSNRGFVIANATSLEWYKYNSEAPFFGTWVHTPPEEFGAPPSPETLFDAWKISEQAPEAVMLKPNIKDLNESEIDLFTAWIKVFLESENPVVTPLSELEGNGWGVEAFAIYLSKDNKYAIVTFVDHGPGSPNTYAGGIFTDYKWLEKFIKDNGDDWVDEMRDYIDDNKGANVSLSNGGYTFVNKDGMSLNFQAGVYTVFTIKPVIRVPSLDSSTKKIKNHHHPKNI